MFDWALRNIDTVQWAAFPFDYENESLQVTREHRVALTYNLFWASHAS
jgi:hypothetical protein